MSRFFFDYATTPASESLFAELDAASVSLFEKLGAIRVEGLALSDYSKRYFGKYLSDLTYTLQLYSFILSVALSYPNAPMARFTLLDYGGGCGMLSLLARESGVGTVIYNDLYGPACRDAEVIGEQLELSADAYVQGDIDEVIRFLQKRNLSCNSIASHDVLEHIYDVESFFKKLPLLSNGAMNVTMVSGANIQNRRVRRHLMRQQFEVEHLDKEFRSKDIVCDYPHGYLAMRHEIVLDYLKVIGRRLADGEVEVLARKTRGLMKPEICKAVDGYLNAGIMPPAPSHLTNTCDPCTGNWCEHLLDHRYLRQQLSDAGFRVKILSGYYGRGINPIKRRVKKLLNIGIRVLGQQGVWLAPFFTLYGEK